MKEGVQWLDTSQNPPVLKERRNGEWVPVSAISDYQKAREAALKEIANLTAFEEHTHPHAARILDAALSAFEAHGLVLVPAALVPVGIIASTKHLMAGGKIDAAGNAGIYDYETNTAALKERQKK